MRKSIRHRLTALKTGWYIWLFPLFAILISGWLLSDYLAQRGPRIFITLEDAGSVKAEKTTVRYRGVPIGVVKDVRISDDEKEAVAEVLLRRDAKSMAVEGSKFSLVKPKVDFQGISGLETLFDGTYFAVIPGPENAPHRSHFKAATGLITDPLDETSPYLIETQDVESIATGNAVTYRGLKVGSVVKLFMAKGGQQVHVQINIENRYAYLVRQNSVFWRKVGVQAKFGLFGSDIKLSSLESIINGGVQFATPNNPGPQAHALTKFAMAQAAPKDYAQWQPKLEPAAVLTHERQ